MSEVDSDARPALRASSRRTAMGGALLGLIGGILYFGVLSPRLSIQHQKAYRASCQSNLKQIGLAYLQYITDYDEKYPRLWTDGDGSGQFDSARDFGWAQNLGPYLKKPQLFQCPAEANEGNLRGGNVPNYSDYWMNARLATLSESQLTNSQRTLSLGDGLNGTSAQSVAGLKYFDAAAQRRHLDGFNALFTDGHVKWLQITALSDGSVARATNSFSPR